MEYQLRITRIRPGMLEAFAAEWTATVARLRRRRGFVIAGAWTVEDANEFVWVLGYDGDEGFAAADAAYYASEERKALQPDPARLIEASTGHMVHRVV